jgi:catechol 2,3-dioxygenase-like lactoylglutathione lyase family enzyme
MDVVWPPHLPASTVRFARPTARLEACAAFYRDALGLEVLAEFHDHDGYEGVVIGLPDRSVQLELTRRAGAPAPPEPTAEHQLVFYLGDAAALSRAESRLRAHGILPVPPENPYWTQRGATAFTDPDGWVVILAPWTYR